MNPVQAVIRGRFRTPLLTRFSLNDRGQLHSVKPLGVVKNYRKLWLVVDQQKHGRKPRKRGHRDFFSYEIERGNAKAKANSLSCASESYAILRVQQGHL
ncbi:hypothetical protein Bca52824_087052 [Brassica carinata]|uniref:Uncharacterized protein n=1 Tax=Brassica carinata TaxID=52824 RepID=A0A8X7TMU3_BRACI|nr:hypothetical protein Bca52824_087052 [Brassica carinata]